MLITIAMREKSFNFALLLKMNRSLIVTSFRVLIHKLLRYTNRKAVKQKV